MKPKALVELKKKRKVTIYVREDCADNGCMDPNCDVCHLHDMPADELGLCEDCNVDSFLQ